MRLSPIGLSILACSSATPLAAQTLAVGPGQAYATPCAAIAAAAPGSTILIDAAGSYAGDVCSWTKNGLTLRGVNGRAHLDAAGTSAQGKAIWVITGDDTVVENIEFYGCHVPDGNGAGIRMEQGTLTVKNATFADGQSGILAANDLTGDITIDQSTFAGLGNDPTGNGAHGIYIGGKGGLVAVDAQGNMYGARVSGRGVTKYVKK